MTIVNAANVRDRARSAWHGRRSEGLLCFFQETDSEIPSAWPASPLCWAGGAGFWKVALMLLVGLLPLWEGPWPSVITADDAAEYCHPAYLT